jgi:hypothetical protein
VIFASGGASSGESPEYGSSRLGVTWRLDSRVRDSGWSARVQTNGAECLAGAVGFDEGLDRVVPIGERG